MRHSPFLLAGAIAALTPAGTAFGQEARVSQILATFLRNLPGVELSAAPGIQAILQEAGATASDPAGVLALALTPSGDGATTGATGGVRIEGACEGTAGSGPECRLRFLQTSGTGRGGDSAVVLIFRLDRPVGQEGARILGPVRVELAG